MRILRLADQDGPRQVFDRAEPTDAPAAPDTADAEPADTDAAELATLEAARAALD